MATEKEILEMKTLPMIAMRGIVLFPNMILHFDVGRKKSIAALEEAMKSDRTVFLSAQKNIEDDEITASGVNKVGVVAEVRQVLKSDEDTVRVLVEGKYRAKLADVISEDPYFIVQVHEYPLKEIKPKNQFFAPRLCAR